MTTRRFCLPAAAFVALALASALAPPVAARATISPTQAQRDLNQLRAGAGLPRVARFSDLLNRGCRMHNRYMLATGEFGHLERRDSAYYTASGARAAARSVIAQPGALPSRAWGDTVYHRIALLQPRLRTAGYDASHGFTCMQVLSGVSRSARARAGGIALFSWPPDGSQGYPPAFSGGEFPDPLADAPGAAELGTPVTVTVNGPWKYWMMVRSNVTSASLVSDLGAPVPLSVSDLSSANAAYLQGGFALLPRQALAPLTWYTATAGGTLNYRGRSWYFQLSTRFQTGAEFY